MDTTSNLSFQNFPTVKFVHNSRLIRLIQQYSIDFTKKNLGLNKMIFKKNLETWGGIEPGSLA